MLMFRRIDNLEVTGYSDSGFPTVLIHENQYQDTFLCLSMELYLGRVQSRP